MAKGPRYNYNKTTLKDHILQVLNGQEVETDDLIFQLKKLRCGVNKQVVRNTLLRLKREGKITQIEVNLWRK